MENKQSEVTVVKITMDEKGKLKGQKITIIDGERKAHPQIYDISVEGEAKLLPGEDYPAEHFKELHRMAPLTDRDGPTPIRSKSEGLLYIGEREEN